MDSLRIALIAVAAAGALAALLESALLWASPGYQPLTLVYPGVALGYVLAGAVAWRRRPGSLLGALIMLGGGALLVAGVTNTELPGLELVGALASTWILAVIVHLLLGFPGGRVRGWMPRAIVLTAWANSVILQVPAVFDLAHARAWYWAQSAVGVAVMVSLAGVLVARLRVASPDKRRTLVPLYAYGMAVATLIPTASILLGGVLGLDPMQVWGVQIAAIAGVPIAFLATSVFGSYAPTSEADALAAWLSTGPGRVPVAAALTRALGDPTVALAYWVPERSEFIDDAGLAVEVPCPGSTGQDSVRIEVGGELVGAIVFDPTATSARAVTEAAHVVALAVEGERLTAALRASRAALLRSRARIVESGDAVRTAIARDLHDGLQVRLVLLGVEAQRLADAAEARGAVELAADATALRKSIDDAARELRRLARQVMPSTLEERGLALAVEDLTDRMPIPTRFDQTAVPTDLPQAVALTAYFAVAEGLSNAVKHARATRATVTIDRDDRRVVVEVSDDGAGGATPRRASGIAGLRDRVEAVGGRLNVDSPAGRGTTLRVEVPCES